MSSSSVPLSPGSVSLRLYPHALEDPTAVLDELQRQASLAVASGFEGVMLSERHGGAWGQIPNPLQAAGWLLGAMTTGWVAPCPILLPLRRTAVLAEEIAWLDARYPGRVGAGFGSGGNESDFRLVGVPFEERNARFDRALREIVAILRDGRHPETRATDPAIVRVARSGLPLLSAAMSARAARRAAEIRIGIIGSSLLSETRTRELADLYTGHGGVGPHVLIARVWLGSPPWDLVERQLEEYRRASADNLTTPAGGELLHGDDPSGIAEQLAHRMRSTRADALNIRVHVRGVEPAAAREQIAAVGAEIVPRVRAASAP